MSFVGLGKRKETTASLLAVPQKSKFRVVKKSKNASTKAHSKSKEFQYSVPANLSFDSLRRSSVKIFSRLRTAKRSSRSVHARTESALRQSNHSAGFSFTKKDVEQINLTPHDDLATTINNAPTNAVAIPSSSLGHGSSSPLARTPNLDGESEPIISYRDSRPTVLHTSRSTPGLSWTLSTKISNSFQNNETVIHRPKLSPRATVDKDTFEKSANDQIRIKLRETEFHEAPSLPYSFLRSSNTPLTLSTAPTSLLSSGATISAETVHRTHHRLAHNSTGGSYQRLEPTLEQEPPRFLVFPRQDAPRLSKPSIVTIETAAAAKVFFESYFDEILRAEITPRSMRRRQMERKLLSMSLSYEKHKQKRLEWYMEESRHLRQMRLMKSKTLARQNMKGAHASNYDMIRVLGKGSFGVVRLVREKSDNTGSSTGSSNRQSSGFDGSSSQENKKLRFKASSNQKPKQVFAMKVIRKSDMLRNSQEGHLRAERDFLVASENSAWVVPLLAAFQDNQNLYLVMEYMMGGDFLGLLLRQDVLDEPVARWYIAEMILCIEEAHKMNWIHRDVKPDNFLITASGHLKISDFGLAFDGHWTHSQTYYNEQRYSLLHGLNVNVEGDANDVREAGKQREKLNIFEQTHRASQSRNPMNTRQRAANGPIIDWLNRTQRRHYAKSVVGTSQYMAPEVIQGLEYDGRCDWWSIGIILYECLYGSTPFFSDDRDKTKHRIVKHRDYLHFPVEQRIARPRSDYIPLMPVTIAAIDLMSRLLTNRQYRLSTSRYRENDWMFRDRAIPGSRLRYSNHPRQVVFPNDAEDIKAHPFFRGIPWSRLHLSQPPFAPHLRGDQPITKYFDDEEEIMSQSDHLDTSTYEKAPAMDDPDGSVPAPVDRTAPSSAPALGTAEPKQTPPVSTPYGAFRDSMRKLRRRKDKKRPRDKLLRDPQFGRTVLEIRKKGAFIGYTYRRPTFSLADLEDNLTSGRAQAAKPSVVAAAA